MSFDLVELSSVAATFNGKTPSRAQQRDSGFPVLKIKDVSEERRFRGKFQSFVDDDVADKSKEKLLKYHDTLILNAAHNADYVGSKQYRAEKEVVGSLPTGEWLLVRSFDDKKLHPMYLNFYLRSNFARHQIKALVKGIHLYPKDVARLKIPLPPLPIQKQIAAVLEKADTLRSQCQQMEQEFNSLAQSVFLDMFGDPVQNERGWKTCKLKDLVKDLQGGKSIAASEDEENSGNHRVLKISAVTWGEFKPTESKPLPNSYVPPKEHFVRPNDLLFSRANTTELVGATSLVFNAPENVLLPDKLWRFIWKDETAQSQVFMWQLLSNQSVRRELGKVSTGSGGSMKNISKAKLYDFEIIYPDKQLQLEFELKFINIREQLSSNIELKKCLSMNFNSLMQRAFKGELTLKDVA